MTRHSFLLSTALAAGAAAGPGVRAAFAQAGGGDTDILNFALTLELLEARFYEEGLQRVRGLRSEYREVATEIRDNESEHVEVLSLLIGQLGATPVTEPQFDFGDAFASESGFLEVAQRLEDTGVAAYNGQGTRLTKATLAVAATVVSVEARHAAWIRHIAGKPDYSGGRATYPAPSPYDPALTKRAVEQVVASTGFITGG